MSQLHSVARANPKKFYGLLMKAAADSLQQLVRDPRYLGARVGILAVLHTWGQKLNLHPHLHCLVPAGGLSIDGDWWVWCRRHFFLPVRVLSRLFRGKLLAALQAAVNDGRLQVPDRPAFEALLTTLYGKPWMVYSKPPFGGPRQALHREAPGKHQPMEPLRHLRLDHGVNSHTSSLVSLE